MVLCLVVCSSMQRSMAHPIGVPVSAAKANQSPGLGAARKVGKKEREEDPTGTITCISFAFQNGVPAECDLYADLRGLRNPAWQLDNYKTITGLSSDVQRFVFQSEQALEIYQKLKENIEFLSGRVGEEGNLMVALGCKSGQHRSVAFVEKIRGDRSRFLQKSFAAIHLEISGDQALAPPQLTRLKLFQCNLCAVSASTAIGMNEHLLSKKHAKKKAKVEKKKKLKCTLDQGGGRGTPLIRK